MSLKTMPRFGKSGTSRISRRRSACRSVAGSLHRVAGVAVHLLPLDRLAERGLDPEKAVDLLEHLHRNAHRAGLLGETAQDGLLDPDRGVGAEPEPTLGFETIHRVDQPQIAFLDEVEQSEPAVAVAARDV